MLPPIINHLHQKSKTETRLRNQIKEDDPQGFSPVGKRLIDNNTSDDKSFDTLSQQFKGELQTEPSLSLSRI
jgi:hypothetical protein